METETPRERDGEVSLRWSDFQMCLQIVGAGFHAAVLQCSAAA